MPLLERQALLQQLQDLLREAGTGSGRLVSLIGEAGVGKSALAHALAATAQDNFRVLWGACEDLSTPQPLGPLHDLARAGRWTMSLAASETQIALFNEALEQLRAQPTLVVLEDLHWADDATIDFIRFLGRRIELDAVMVLVTARNDQSEARSRLRRALVNVPPPVLTRIEVPRLSERAVQTLARAHGQNGARIFALTGGNPFLTLEVLKTGEDFPATARDALLFRAERLSPGARDALEAAAIFPRRVEDWLLVATCGGAADESIGECVAAGMLTSDQGCFAFSHEIARRTIERDIDPLTKTRLHERALAALRARDPNATARLVHHAIAAGDADAICEFAPRAAAEAARIGAHRQAAQHLAATLSFAHILPAAERANLFEQSAFELQLTGRVSEAIEAHQAALELRRAAGDQAAVGDTLRWLSRLHYNIGDRLSANRYGVAAIEKLEALGPSAELAMAYANYALIKALEDEHAAGIEWAERTIELALSLHRSDIVADAHAALAHAKQWIDYDAARAHIQQGLSFAIEHDRIEMAGRIYSIASCIEINTRHSERARNIMEIGLDYCAGRDLDTWAGYIQGWMAELAVREGKWAQARSLASPVAAEESYSQLLRFPARAALARLEIRERETDPVALLSELKFGDEPQRLLIYAPIFGERAWLRETDRDETLALLSTAADVAAHIGNPWAAGEIAFWRRKLGEQFAITGAIAPPFALQFAGDWRAAAAAWEALPAPYEQALALLDGDEEASAAGLTLLEELGAVAAAERARKELRHRGLRFIARGPRASTRANAAGLTERQMGVLRLMAEGHSNAAIAEALGVSVKTVDHHVSAVLAKLGVSSRSEAASRAKESGLIGSH